ncbi:MAG: methylmalonyl-CoA decarboxylase [Bacteroidota bacterium]
MKFIETKLENLIGIITFNNDEKRNSLTEAMLNEIIEALHKFKENNARVVIIRAHRGVRIWSAGLDIHELPEPGRDPLSYNDPLEQAIRVIQHYPGPVIAMIEGGVWGGACDLAFVCDLLIGTETASFAITPAKIGVPYNPSGILHFINMVGLHLAKEMFFTALPINATQAKHHGILNHLVPNVDELESYTMFHAEQMIQNSPLSIAVIKEQLRILGNSNAISPETFERIQGLRRKVYDSKDYIEGKRAFLEKRKPVFIGE